MGVLVAQQIARRGGVLPIGEVFRDGAVFAGTVMLQPDAAHAIRQRQEEIVVVVVVRAERLVRLLHQIAVRLQLIVVDVEVARPIGNDVHVDGSRAVRV
jgi:hypothetical protein